ncbi:MAG: hypothetical protein J6Q22_10075 [Prevotella sp.]|nr:hypothetical protein [Prevotella sp.]
MLGAVVTIGDDELFLLKVILSIGGIYLVGLWITAFTLGYSSRRHRKEFEEMDGFFIAFWPFTIIFIGIFEILTVIEDFLYAHQKVRLLCKKAWCFFKTAFNFLTLLFRPYAIGASLGRKLRKNK